MQEVLGEQVSDVGSLHTARGGGAEGLVSGAHAGAGTALAQGGGGSWMGGGGSADSVWGQGGGVGDGGA